MNELNVLNDFRRSPPMLAPRLTLETGGFADALDTASRRPTVAAGLSGVDLPRIEAAVREILLAVGDDPDRDGLIDTPRRVARAYAELFAGLRESPAGHLGRVFQQESDQAVIVRDIQFFSLCEHHLLPFTGKVHVAYLPQDGRVVGLSKLARTVDVFARRPQLQERLTEQVAEALMEHIPARGAAVIVEGEHYCMKMRGVLKPGATMVTSAFRGDLAADPDAKAVVVAMLTGGRPLADVSGPTPHDGCNHHH
jgi:GTP cyclohydrolase I